ncbi:MAG: AMP-dependent synthetase/ligase [Pelagibacteraceae bacterium]
MDISKINSLVELYFAKSRKVKPDTMFLKWLKPNYTYSHSWGEVEKKIFKLSHCIKNIIDEGDRCLLISENRPEWLISDISIMNAGGISVPIFTTYSFRDYEYIINDCKPSLIIVSNNDQFKKIKKFINNKVKKIISFEKLEYESLSLDYIFKTNIKYELINNNLKRKMPACIIYTSGTSGNPKGVILSHGGILSNCEGSLEILNPLIKKSNPVFLTWLPLSHSYEHTVQYIQILIGAQIFYAEGLEKLISNMMYAKPTIMTAVPRFYQNLYTKININFSKLNKFKKFLIFLTLQLGKKKLNKIRLNFFEKILDFLCGILIRKKIQKQFGGNIQAFISGGGALDQKIGEFLNSIGLTTLQGYGLTEASPVVSCNLPNNVKVETVGPSFSTNQVKIGTDGEILVKGENVMLGYWNMEKETKEVIKDGWLYTGDIGEFDSNGFLKITDRKKDIIVNLGGDNISPTKIENLLCLNESIKQTFVYGDKKNYLVALIVTDETVNKEKIKIIVENLNKKLSLIEKIKKFVLIHNEFSIENRMLTPTLKLKRKEIVKNYKQELENLY